MLKSFTLDYYYSNIDITGLTINFDQICYPIQVYFEIIKYYKSILFKQNFIILRLIIIANKDKIIKELLQLLIKKLRHPQHRLDFELCTNNFIYNKLINTYQNIFICKYICFKPSDLLAGFINNLLFFDNYLLKSLFI